MTLARLRIDLGWTQAQAARESGGRFLKGAIGMYESGARAVSVEAFIDLCSLYGVEPDEAIREVDLRLARKRLSRLRGLTEGAEQ